MLESATATMYIAISTSCLLLVKDSIRLSGSKKKKKHKKKEEVLHSEKLYNVPIYFLHQFLAAFKVSACCP